MKNDFFSFVYGVTVLAALQEEATHRTNRLSRDGGIVGITEWNKKYEEIFSDLKLDFIKTRV